MIGLLLVQQSVFKTELRIGLHRQFLIVGDHNQSGTIFLIEFQQKFHHLSASFFIQVPGWFIC